ncbi:unnamed protein product [marine sediment metagenome]|uniref:Uncharacterized protein n=1 Tax=marine sediment metagenome TaxID=412755 RepID=X0YTN9_9ZZZZ
MAQQTQQPQRTPLQTKIDEDARERADNVGLEFRRLLQGLITYREFFNYAHHAEEEHLERTRVLRDEFYKAALKLSYSKG